MISKHDEIEVKLPADAVAVEKFKRHIVESVEVERFLHVEGPDCYYENGANVIRHRQDPNGCHELTVKRRKSDRSTQDCHEIDLHMDLHLTTPADVKAFMAATGFEYQFTLVKDSHIFWARLGRDLLATFVLYDAWRADAPQDKKRFIEIEAEKGSPCSPETAKRHIRAWTQNLQNHLGAGDPANVRLYEMFSGKRYQIL